MNQTKGVKIPYPEDCKGQLVVISGFSGAGKDTVVKKIMKKHKNYAYSVSVTTRKPRENEVDGKDYFFVSKEEFRCMQKNNSFLETSVYCEENYGTPLSNCLQMLQQGTDVVLILDIAGAKSVKEIYPPATLIFMTVPDFSILETRLRRRGETEDKITERMYQALEETKSIAKYDYVVCNRPGESDACAEEIHSIISTQKATSAAQFDHICQLHKQAVEWANKRKGETNAEK